jgi:T5SS/PEP-CTERM-associated repeat protein
MLRSRLLIRAQSVIFYAVCMVWIAALCGLHSALADDNWINAGTGGWDTAANWSAGVPISTSIVDVFDSGTVQVTNTDVASSLFLSQATPTAAPSNLQVFSILPSVPASLTVSNLFYIGGFGEENGPGTLSISGHTSVQAGYVAIGSSATGTVTVQGASSSFTINNELTVGNGSLTVSSGATMASGTTVAVGLPATPATITIENSGTTFTNTNDFQIGDQYGDQGIVTVASGGKLAVTGTLGIYLSSTVNIGAGGTSGTVTAATITVNGLLNYNTTDTLSNTLPIVGSGNVQNSASGTTTLSNVATYTGAFTANAGQLILQGTLNSAAQVIANSGGIVLLQNASVSPGSTNMVLTANADSKVEYNTATLNGVSLRGSGTHVIVPGGTTTMNNVTTFSSTTLLQNAAANFNYFTNGGMLTTGAVLNWNAGSNSSSGVMTVNSPVNVQDFTNNGVITINSGASFNNSTSSLVFGGGSRTTVNPGGAINLLDANTLELNGALLINQGAITGTTDVNYGSTAQGNGSYGSVNVALGGKFSPTNVQTGAATVNADYTQSSGGSLLMDIGGTSPATQYDQLHVAGNLKLDGNLIVSLLGGFHPVANQSFDILDWSGALTGTFALLQLPTLPGSLVWITNKLYTAGILSVADSDYLPGDFNRDGHVDASDLLAMEQALVNLPAYQSSKSLTTAQLLAIGDVNGDGKVDNSDLQALLNLLKSGGGSNNPVPEPSTLVLGVLAALTLRGVRCKWPS